MNKEDLVTILRSLKDSACGADELSPKIIKMAINFITDHLLPVCNKSLSYGIFPAELKIGKNVVPIYKNGDIMRFRFLISEFHPALVLRPGLIFGKHRSPAANNYLSVDYTAYWYPRDVTHQRNMYPCNTKHCQSTLFVQTHHWERPYTVRYAQEWFCAMQCSQLHGACRNTSWNRSPILAEKIYNHDHLDFKDSNKHNMP